MNMKSVFIFVAGAALGAGGTYLVMKKHFETKLEDEVNAVRNEINRIVNKPADPEEEPHEEASVEPKKDEHIPETHEEYVNMIVNYNKNKTEETKGASDVAEAEAKEIVNGIPKPKKEGKKKKSKYRDPFEINLDDWEYENGYAKVDCAVYQDGYLVDEDDSVLEPAESISRDMYKKVQDYGDSPGGIFYVRNERLEIDYRVVLSPHTYEEVIGLSYDWNRI